MGLRDVTSVVFDRGIGSFNEAAALEAYHLIAKMDDSDASEFVFHVVNEVVQNTIVENREAVQKHLDRTIAKALVYSDLDAATAGLSADERQEVKKQLLEAVSKASEAEKAAWAHRDKGGRFTTFKHDVAPGALGGSAGKALQIPEHPEWGSMSEEQKASYRSQYMQIANHLVQHGGFHGNNDVMLHYAGGDTKPMVAATKYDVARAINPEGPDVEGVTVRPYAPTVNGQIADLTRSLGASTEAGLKTVGGDRPNMGTQGTSGFVDQWYTASPTSNQQMYNRIGAGSKLLEQVGGPKLSVAAKFGSLVGQHGAQAENVFGPPVRRMAYRYRGTERKPDRELAQSYGDAIMRAKQGGAMPNRRQDEDVAAYQERVRQGNAGRAPTWQEREAGREAVIDWLQHPDRAPSKGLSNLQLAAGHTPPSQGVLLNANGQIVTTAAGAADDWYLPFNLKHLQSLKGGEYIRSRSTGGLTTEDIYTGLMTGARRVTVVSRSGIFSMEFDPELRGGRRNNDKALRMSKRYGELLDAVQSGKVERHNLSPEAMSEVRSTIAGMYPEGSLTPSERETATQMLMQQRKEHPEQIDAAIAALDDRQLALKREQDRELTPDEEKDFERERAGLLSQREYFHRLNGLGYEAAQTALKEQFPYYIASAPAKFRVGRSSPLGSNDKGYVEPGALRPTAARANLFGGARGPGGGKINEQEHAISARTAGRAVPYVDRNGRPPADSAAASESPDAPKDGGGGGAGKMPAARQSADKIAADLKRNEAKQAAAIKVHSGLKAWVNNILLDHEPSPAAAKLREYAKKDPTPFAVEMLKPGAPDKFFDAVDEAISAHPDHKFHGREDMEAARDKKGGGAYSPEAAMVAPLDIYSFDGEDQATVLNAPKQRLMLTPGKTAGEADDDELAKEATLQATLLKTVSQTPAGPDRYTVVTNILKDAGLMPADEVGVSLIGESIREPSLAQKRMKSVQIVRADRAGGGEKLALPSAPVVPESPEVARFKNMSHAEQEEEMKRMARERGDIT